MADSELLQVIEVLGQHGKVEVCMHLQPVAGSRVTLHEQPPDKVILFFPIFSFYTT
jgi:hypothetical protein